MTTEGFQRILDASEEEQRELRMLRAGGILPLGTPSTPSPAAAAKTPAQSSPAATGGRPPPGSPSLLTGLMDGLRKLPSFVTNAKAASESRRRRRRRNARVGGAARVTAVSLGASGSEEAKDGREAPVVESDLALARQVQGEEDAEAPEARQRAPRSEAAGAAAARDWDVEMGEGGGGRGAGRTGSLARVAAPEVFVSTWTRGGVAAGSGGLAGGGRVGDDVRDQDGGRDERRRQGGGELSLDAAMSQSRQREVSSSELFVSSSGSGSAPRVVSSDSPSTDSLLGVRFSSRSGGRGSRKDGPGRSGGGGVGEGPPRRGGAPPDGAPAGERSEEWRGGGPEGMTTQELRFSGARAEEAVAEAGMAHLSSSRGLGSGRGLRRLDDTADGSSSSSRSPAGVARLERSASTTPGFEPTFRHQHDRAAGEGAPPTAYHTDTAEIHSNTSSEPRLIQALGGDGPAGTAGSGSGGGLAPGMTEGVLDGSDRVSREDGVEGLEMLSPVVTEEDSPNWVPFSDWIGLENGGKKAGEGGGYGAGAGRGRLAGVEYWPSPGVGGRGDSSSDDSDRERQMGRWFSDESSWSTG